MSHRILGALVVAAGIGGFVLADETAGRITEVEDGSITITVMKKRGEKGEGKTFEVSEDVKVVRTGGKDEGDVELETATEVTNDSATIARDGEVGREIEVQSGPGGRTRPKARKDDK